MSDNKPRKPVFYTQFPLEQYQQSPDVVKRANDTYIEGFKVVMEDYYQLEGDFREQERNNIILNETVDNLRKFQFVQAILTIVALILIGIGVNKLTATPPDLSSGWALIISGAVVQIVAAIMLLIRKSRG